MQIIVARSRCISRRERQICSILAWWWPCSSPEWYWDCSNFGGTPMRGRTLRVVSLLSLSSRDSLGIFPPLPPPRSCSPLYFSAISFSRKWQSGTACLCRCPVCSGWWGHGRARKCKAELISKKNTSVIDDGGVEMDSADFCVSCLSWADSLVWWIFQMSSRVAWLNFGDASESLEDCLYAPEAAASDDGSTHLLQSNIIYRWL